jgi:hypothetical protein
MRALFSALIQMFQLSSTTGTADVIVVGGGGLAEDLDLDPDPELDSDSSSNLDPDLAVGSSILKLQYNSVRLYCTAIINLYA